jgi:hypothetical protein
MFDGWEVYRNNTDVSFRKAGKIILKDSSTKSDINVDEFLQKDFDNLNIDSLGVDQPVIDIIKERLAEIKNCLNSKSPLATIFLCGSTLEGILLGLAIKNIKQFNTSKSAPRHKDGKVKKIHDWTLSSLIDVAAENGFLQKDVKKFSHTLRDFRNYIHPYEQLSEGFNPSDDTSKICWQVLQAAISQISQKSV